MCAIDSATSSRGRQRGSPIYVKPPSRTRQPTTPSNEPSSRTRTTLAGTSEDPHHLDPAEAARLRDRTFAGMKRAGRWAMTEAQIEAAIQSMCIELRLPDPPSPSGVSKHSRHGRRLREWGSSVVELLRANGISRAVGEEETGFSEVDDLQGGRRQADGADRFLRFRRSTSRPC